MKKLAVCVLYWGLLVCLMCVLDTLYSVDVVVLISFTILAINTIIAVSIVLYSGQVKNNG